jgi:alpha-L-fucosidase 2
MCARNSTLGRKLFLLPMTIFNLSFFHRILTGSYLRSTGLVFPFCGAMAVLVGSCTTLPESSPAGISAFQLHYLEPASNWNEALPLGNGRLGAMVFGGVSLEHIQFNEETLWTGEPRSYAHDGAAGYLNDIRRLLFAGKQAEAEKLAQDNFMSVPLRQMAYQPFGDLYLEFDGHENFED